MDMNKAKTVNDAVISTVDRKAREEAKAEKVEIALNLLKMGLSVKQVAEATKFTVEEYVCLDDLTDRAEKMAIGDDAKKDLLKMVEYNYKYFENKEKVTNLMDQYQLNDTPLKPLAEVVR